MRAGGVGAHPWKTLDENYNFALDLIPIRGLSKELWSRKVAGFQTLVVSRVFFRTLGTKSHSDVGVARRHKEYYMGEGGGFPQVQAMVFLWIQSCPCLVLALQVLQNAV
jgi:hypothetical protein